MANWTAFWKTCTGCSCQIYPSFCLSHLSQRFIKFSECLWALSEHLWPGGSKSNWLSRKNKSPSSSLINTWCCKLYRSSKCICHEEINPGLATAYSHGYRTRHIICIQWRWISVAAHQRQQESYCGLCLYLPNVFPVTPQPPHLHKL